MDVAGSQSFCILYLTMKAQISVQLLLKRLNNSRYLGIYFFCLTFSHLLSFIYSVEGNCLAVAGIYLAGIKVHENPAASALLILSACVSLNSSGSHRIPAYST